jgi:cytochrome c oxidase cbb3-type subunit I/II
MLEPTSISPGSIMPAYPWLITNQLNNSSIERKIEVLRGLGVPYEEGMEANVHEMMRTQAEEITERLAKDGIEVKSDREIVALIAYLQRLGTDIKGTPESARPRK